MEALPYCDCSSSLAPRLTLQCCDADRRDFRIGHCQCGAGLGRVVQRGTPPARNHCRHWSTVTFAQRSVAATATLDSPRAHLRTIFARNATCRFVRARLASRSRSTRSTALASRLVLGQSVLVVSSNTLPLTQDLGSISEGPLAWWSSRGGRLFMCSGASPGRRPGCGELRRPA